MSGTGASEDEAETRLSSLGTWAGPMIRGRRVPGLDWPSQTGAVTIRCVRRTCDGLHSRASITERA